MRVLLSLTVFCFVSLFAGYRENIDAILGQENAQVGILVVSLSDGRVVYERNRHLRFVPASTAKLFTVAAGLDQLGVDFQFKTEMRMRGKIEGSALSGDLVLVGGGDPSLKRYHFQEFVEVLKSKNIEVIRGDLIVDAGCYDEIACAPGWMWDDSPTSWNPPLGGLNIDHSRIVLAVEAGEVGKAPTVRILNSGEEVTIQNRAKTIQGKKSEISVERPLSSLGKSVVVEGSVIADEAPRIYKVPAVDPTRHAAMAFSDELKKQGILLQGRIKFESSPRNTTALAVQSSASLADLSKKMLKDSDNYYADSLFKQLGAKRGQGSWQSGSRQVRNFLQEKLSSQMEDFVVLDGSGLSRYNLASPSHFVSLLQWVHDESPYAEEFKAALSIGGVDGTLKKRFDTGRFRSRIRGKTGTMTGVSSISGYLVTKDKELLAFSIIANGFVEKVREWRARVEDPIINELILCPKQRVSLNKI
ncbi:MAG: D-alanyl-D-alanine carboxypeptidase/D-alanyl-D-alanine-endopeptidase [Candidatus Algichlamydia australiensis]|nr:D-alanyl-D-alanine carboxypeptidase/D-alanyl-D-alanine-endopeptidase [Chlamydiales bacterium]